MKSVFIVSTEDRTVEGVCDSLAMARDFCREYADCCDATISEPEWREPADFEIRGHWRVSCYPKDASTEGMGFVFDLTIDEKDFYSAGDKFPVDLTMAEAADSISHYLRQAE